MISDTAPNMSGNPGMDISRSMALVKLALDVAVEVSCPAPVKSVRCAGVFADERFLVVGRTIGVRLLITGC